MAAGGWRQIARCPGALGASGARPACQGGGARAWWTNRSSPPSVGVMKPKPLVELNHLTVPVALLASAMALADTLTARARKGLVVEADCRASEVTPVLSWWNASIHWGSRVWPGPPLGEQVQAGAQQARNLAASCRPAVAGQCSPAPP